jgi:hypothetical protein
MVSPMPPLAGFDLLTGKVENPLQRSVARMQCRVEYSTDNGKNKGNMQPAGAAISAPEGGLRLKTLYRRNTNCML